MIVKTSKPPYYAVIFLTIVEDSIEGYIETADRMESLARKQKGFSGMESARSEVGITVSYWQIEEDIIAWKNNVEHAEARDFGRKNRYKQYQLRICKVEGEYGFKKISL